MVGIGIHVDTGDAAGHLIARTGTAALVATAFLWTDDEAVTAMTVAYQQVDAFVTAQSSDFTVTRGVGAAIVATQIGLDIVGYIGCDGIFGVGVSRRAIACIGGCIRSYIYGDIGGCIAAKILDQAICPGIGGWVCAGATPQDRTHYQPYGE
tara:strand:+ start:383 stop:838 length:456 start_codon:yes stop_codon:yes gene_type:complete